MAAMEQVRTGMRVVDSSGDEVGTVEDLKMGDPEAATAAGQGSGEPGVAGDELLGVGGGLPPERAERLLRTGYLKVDSKGLFTGDTYVPADRVARVEGDTVHLNVPKDQAQD